MIAPFLPRQTGYTAHYSHFLIIMVIKQKNTHQKMIIKGRTSAAFYYKNLTGRNIDKPRFLYIKRKR
ncbi:hypothetical protein EBQ93_01365 [bacterium]|nr:hypothetical protein [bacterium]